MLYKTEYKSPIGKLLIVSNETSLIGLWIEGQKYFLSNLKENVIENDNIEILKKTKSWLDSYFKGEKPSISTLSLAPIGSEFRKRVWNILKQIPYGETITYGEIAKKIALQMHKKTMSSQAVGNAVGHNPISIIIPCHRVIGKSGNLTGYAGGIDKKVKLLSIENIDVKQFSMPKNKKV